MQKVYVIKGNGAYKIGISDDPHRRMNDLQAASPDKLTMLMIINTDQPSRLESRLHNYFARKRVHHEWFDLSPQDITYLHEQYDAIALEPLPVIKPKPQLAKKEVVVPIRSLDERLESMQRSAQFGFLSHVLFIDPLYKI